MVDPNIEKLLVLQDRDMRRHDLESQLAKIPGDIAALEKKIREEEANREGAREKIRQLEVERKDTDNQIASSEQQVTRYKNQQLEVKKNEEYQALTHEIELAQARIGELEEKAITLMFAIDEEKTRLAKIEGDFEERIGQLREKIDNHRRRGESLKSQLDEARQAVEEARPDVPRSFLATYERQAKAGKFPVVVAVRDRKCQGCHLRVSGEVETGLADPSKITTCDSCGRIVYSER